MSDKLHSLIFLVFLILFIAAAPLALLYSEGYRFNFNSNEVVKTGGFSFKVAPQIRAKVYLDGKKKKKVNGWTYSAYLNALPSKNYNVKIQKEGFYPWKKTLKVKEGKVTEAKNILMVPKEPELEVKVKDVSSFFVSPDESKMAYQNPKQQLNILSLEEEAPTNYPTTTFIKWGPNSERILVNASDTYFILNNQELTEINLPTDLKEIHFNPDQSTELFYTRKKFPSKLLKLDYEEEKPSSTILNFLDYEITSEGIFWLSPSGQVHRSDFSGAIQTTLSSEALPIQKSNYRIIREGGKTLILEDETLYILTEEEEFKQLAINVNQIKLSPHVQKAALVSKHEINIVYLNEQYGQPRQEKYGKGFIARFSQPIEKVSWLDSHHLIFSLEDNNKIKISGIDNRSQINMVDYLNTESEQWYWNSNQESFYLLKDNILYQNSPLKL